jgi:endonuclease/exonuclease/phosphatase family metal-dependent hydrolase
VTAEPLHSLFAQPVLQAEGEDHGMAYWRLTTWNCFGAAQTASAFLQWRGAAAGHRLRHPALRAELTQSTVLCTQEVWLADVEEFFEALPHRHKVRDRNASTLVPPSVGGSGLAVASHLPIVESAQRMFAGPKVHAERAARKGMLHARMEVRPGLQVDIVTTHMQSGYSKEAALVRARQLGELRAFATEKNQGKRDLFVCGDLNLCGLKSERVLEYAALQKHFADFEDVFAETDEPTFCPGEGQNSLAHQFEPHAKPQRLDYILFRRGHGSTTELGTRSTRLTEKMHAFEGNPAIEPSDHAALTLDVCYS